MSEPTDHEESLDSIPPLSAIEPHVDVQPRNDSHREAPTINLRVPAPELIRSTSPFDRDKHGKDSVIDVHFDGTAWCIEDESLEKDLQFTHLADAEARASELSKLTGRNVCVHGQDGELIDSFKSKRN